MKYRIKITTFKNGRKTYTAQFKQGFVWTGISYQAKTALFFGECVSRSEALRRIDLHFAGNQKVQTIEFEYIIK